MFSEPTVSSFAHTNHYVVSGLMEDFSFADISLARHVVHLFLSNKHVDEASSSTTATPSHANRSSFKWTVLARLNESAGLGLSPSFLEELRTSSFEADPFLPRHFLFEERVKSLDVLDRARLLALYIRGIQGASPTDRINLLVEAFETAGRALLRSPVDAWLTLKSGQICLALSRLLDDSADDESAGLGLRLMYAERAETYLKSAIALDSENAEALTTYASLLLDREMHEPAQRALLTALELGSKAGLDAVALQLLCDSLNVTGKRELALKVWRGRGRICELILSPSLIALLHVQRRDDFHTTTANATSSPITKSFA